MRRLEPRKVLNKAFLKIKPSRSNIETFKNNLIQLIDRINESESEEFNKGLVSEFLKKTYYDPNNYINTKGRKDLVVHNGKEPVSSVGVIIEAKKPTNKTEMIEIDNLNKKAFQELVLYYLRERVTAKNTEIKHLIVTNVYEWFIFDAHVFDKCFFQNTKFVKQFMDFEERRLSGKDTDFFYTEIVAPIISEIETGSDSKNKLEFTHFDIRKYEKPLRNNDKQDDVLLITLFKLLSPEHLLKLPFINDSNSLDKSFYTELLHVIGLTEIKEGSKKLIQRKETSERNTASLIESAIIQLDSLDKLSLIKNPHHYGQNTQERLFNISLELVITWVNRILFLKLLEAQQINYHKGDKSFSFLNIEKVGNYDDLNSLFFSVLARKQNERSVDVKKHFSNVPYLNSSLFEPTDLEQSCFTISQLKDGKLPILSSTILKDRNGKKRTGEIATLEYIYEFLNSYDFSSEGAEEIQEDNKTLINASVLGLIFEKINGYKDGAFFTPGFITMYMCRETIRQAIIQKFNELKGWDCKDLNQIHDKIEDKKEANAIINSLKICDPAVGSGHFLVSALNEIIAIKSELKILLDEQGKTLRDYTIEVVNDELIVTDDDGKLFEYNPKNKETCRVQQALFHEKQTIIENCLFGVDINSNSVKICRLRLWIELLKNAYYKEVSNYTELETLPNIDINIKCGNSLVSRYAIDTDIKKALKKNKWTIEGYRNAVMSYRNASSKDEKKSMEKLITEIKNDFESDININDKRVIKLNKLKGELITLTSQISMFEKTKAEKATSEKQIESLKKEIQKLDNEIQEIKSNKIYEDSFEWRFEFPEVLNNDGEFIGFDAVIGNPPYIYRNYDFSKLKRYFSDTYKSNEGNFDLYKYFIERIGHLLKNKGVASYIVPNTFLSAKTYSKLREILISNYEIRELFDLGLDVFEDVTVENIVFRIVKDTNINNDSVLVKVDRRKIKHINNPEKTYPVQLKKLFNQENTFNIYLDSKVDKFINKIREKTIPIGKIAYCTVGINTGYIKDKLVSDRKIDKTYHKVLNGRDIGVYSINWKGDWIKYDKEYVDSFGDLGRTLPQEFIFLEEKILVQRTRRGLARKLVCTFDDEKYYNLNRVSNIVMTSKDYSIKYVIALLNSKLLDYYFNKVFNEYEVKPLHLSMLPIKIQTTTQQKPLIKLVNEILSRRKTDATYDISALENEIDKLVYKLYGLDPEEIKIIEESIK